MMRTADVKSGFRGRSASGGRLAETFEEKARRSRRMQRRFEGWRVKLRREEGEQRN
jgi:hypothetical protein